MNPGKLYTKIFLSFMTVLLVTLALNYGLQEITVRRYFSEVIENFNNQRVLRLKQLAEEKYWSSQKESITENQAMMALMNNIGELQWAEVWISDKKGLEVLKSFPQDIPSDVSKIRSKQTRIFGDITVYYNFNSQGDTYAVAPLDIEGNKYTLNIIFRGFQRPGFNMGRTLGNIGIGIIIALLIIPVSRLITERLKQLRQSALRIARGDLSHRIDVKSSDEIGELSIAFNQMADEVQRMIMGGKELTALVSHELRTPLTRIRIAEEILSEKLEQGKNHEYERHLSDIREDIDVLDRLIGRILELSKIDMHEPRFKMEPIDISKIIEDLLNQLQPIIEHKVLRVRTDLVPVSYRGHEKSLITAMLNVLDNAIKYTVERGEIYVKTERISDVLKISVINTFKKLKEKDLLSIFEPFQRLEASEIPGSGLGLAITQKIIDRHGGKIEAVNTDSGLEIRITLPLNGDQGLERWAGEK